MTWEKDFSHKRRKIGLILFLVWKNDRPKTAKVCGICALVAVIVDVVVSILYVAVLAPIIARLIANL